MRLGMLIVTVLLTACASTTSHRKIAPLGLYVCAQSIPCDGVFFFEHRVFDGENRITRSGAAAVTVNACVANDTIELPEPDHYGVRIDSRSPQQVSFALNIAGEALTTTISLPPKVRVVVAERPLASGVGSLLVTVIAFESADEMRLWMAERMGFSADDARDRKP